MKYTVCVLLFGMFCTAKRYHFYQNLTKSGLKIKLFLSKSKIFKTGALFSDPRAVLQLDSYAPLISFINQTLVEMLNAFILAVILGKYWYQ